MNKKHGFLFGFAVIAIAALFTLAGCDDPNNDNGGKGGDDGITIADFEGAWESYTRGDLTVTKVAGQDKFTLVFDTSQGTKYEYTLSYTGSIAEVIQDNNPDNPLGKGVPFTSTGKQTAGELNLDGGNDYYKWGLFRENGTVYSSLNTSRAGPAGYLLISGTKPYEQLRVYYEDENAFSPITIGGKKHYGDLGFSRPSN